MKTLSITLIILGILMIIFTEVDFTRKEKVIDLGAVEVSKNERETINWPMYAGIIISAAGVVLLVVSNKTKK